MGIELAAVLTASSGDEFEDISQVFAVILLLIPLFVGIAWNRRGKRLMSRFTKGDEELAGRLAYTVEAFFFIAVLIIIAVLYNMGLFIL